MSSVGMSVNSHGILQVVVVMIPEPCRQEQPTQRRIMPKITVTEVGSSQSFHEESVPWIKSGQDWSLPLVTVIVPVQVRHQTLVVTLWVDHSIVTRRLATLPRRGESLVSKVELIYPCSTNNNDDDDDDRHGSWSMYRRWMWVLLLVVVGFVAFSSIIRSVPIQSRRLPVHVVEPTVVIRRRLFVDGDSEYQQQQSLRDHFFGSETDHNDEDGDEYSESIVVDDETTTGSGTNSIFDAQHPQWLDGVATKTDSISLHSSDSDFAENHDLDPTPIRECNGLEGQGQSKEDDRGLDGSRIAMIPATLFACSLSHESSRRQGGANLERTVNNDGNDDQGLHPTPSDDMVILTRPLPHGEVNDARLISPSTLDEHSGILQSQKCEGDCPSDKDSSKSYVSTLPPDSDLVSEDPATNQQESAQSQIACDGHEPTPRLPLHVLPIMNDDQPSTDKPEDHAFCPSPSPKPRQQSPNNTSTKSGKRQREEYPFTPTEDSNVRRGRDHQHDADLGQSQTHDSPSVTLIQVTHAASSSRKRKVRPFSTSQIVPDWIPSKGLQSISNDFVEDSTWNIMMGSHLTARLTPSIPVPKSINVRRSTRKLWSGNYSKA